MGNCRRPFNFCRCNGSAIKGKVTVALMFSSCLLRALKIGKRAKRDSNFKRGFRGR